MKKPTKKQIEKQIEAAFSLHFNRIVIPIFDIPKIFEAARQGLALGLDLNEVMKDLVVRHRVG